MTEPINVRSEALYHFRQESRSWLLQEQAAGDAVVARKSARVIARQIHVPFTVETDRGVMTGADGDWLVTNHPDDDAGSDLWTISDERFRGTYDEEEAPVEQDDGYAAARVRMEREDDARMLADLASAALNLHRAEVYPGQSALGDAIERIVNRINRREAEIDKAVRP